MVEFAPKMYFGSANMQEKLLRKILKIDTYFGQNFWFGDPDFFTVMKLRMKGYPTVRIPFSL